MDHRNKFERKLSIVEEVQGIDKFFLDLAAPSNLMTIREDALAFCERQKAESRCVVLVTVRIRAGCCVCLVLNVAHLLLLTNVRFSFSFLASHPFLSASFSLSLHSSIYLSSFFVVFLLLSSFHCAVWRHDRSIRTQLRTICGQLFSRNSRLRFHRVSFPLFLPSSFSLSAS